MVKQTIQIFARIKPTKTKLGPYEISEDSEGGPLLSFTVPRELAEGYINNKKENYKFKFEKVFEQAAKQDEVFDAVARPVCENVIQGYNSTIFAYGQTGSGKTFTITGGAERYTDRGLIPRIISFLFDYYSKNTELEFTTHISYLEIYNESGYDLLDPKHEAAKLEDLPKVSLMEDADQNIHLKNLSTNQVGNEEEALNLLFLGDTNRMIAETPMNQASTRSHCIFTIHVTSREPGSATIRRSKLHLVDLAGSERVGKTGVAGQLLTEAKYINISLHYLEQVIVALSEKSRSHIPYRNSMMTSVLRDSLGGNCMTTMIATCSVERKNINESISTCRFAQRVALIKNDAILNEELDPKLLILRLKREVQQLKEELAMATGEQRTDALTEEDLERCMEAVERYLNDSDIDAQLTIGADMRKIQECYRILKRRVLDRPESSTPSTMREEPVPPDPGQSAAAVAENQKMKDLMRQRDNEINILVNMLKKEKKRAADAIAQLEQLGHEGPPKSARSRSSSEAGLVNGHSHSAGTLGGHGKTSHPGSVPSSGRDRRRETEQLTPMKEKEQKIKQKILGNMSMGRQEAFEIFRRDYHETQAIEENKDSLKERYAEAKKLGERVNNSRNSITKIKAAIEQHRMSRVMQGLVDPDNPEADDIELEMRQQIEDNKSQYKTSFTRLRSLKTEIEHLQHLLEKSKVKLMKDFELWWAEQVSSNEGAAGPAGNTTSKTAWRTPPTSPGSSRLSASQSNSSLNSISSASDLNHTRGAPIPGHIRGSLGKASSGRPGSDTSGYESGSNRRTSGSRPGSDSSSGAIPLTGDAQADADIMAFLKARQTILTKAQQR